ncbi:MAG: glycosyltransferase family 87 protein [Chloroflexota bacterium]
MRDRLLRDGFIVLSVVFVGLRLFAIEPWADSVDAYAYWTTGSGDFYAAADTGRIGAYLYSPAFAQLLAPLTWLPVNVFTAIWTAINCAALWYLLRRWALPSLLFLPIPFEIISGNVHLLYGVAIVLGFRWSATWALMFITKVTPFVGVLWFAARREWRALALALAATAAIVAVSVILDRAAWEEWIGLVRADLSGSAGQATLDTPGWYLAVPLLPRLVVAAGLAVVAGFLDRRWLLPVVVVVSLPVIWLNSLAVLAAVVPLWSRRSVEVAAPEPEPSSPAAASPA